MLRARLPRGGDVAAQIKEDDGFGGRRRGGENKSAVRQAPRIARSGSLPLTKLNVE
jgi:hypothetical protein